ncbi:HWE histidine kinase domain-containing protein [Aestuariibacter sp. A3R04]|uniref:HWE histidine kinase domain-containing protein n=1 Tax=Aestuariibacter sp. A3R04 TaxID=2841571 RepID=UPI001C08513F|nr:HWE histidine kinase domain-containing protein [Aestuariibacter sp. A3R04]MBU3022666.1 GAF domain-containing protein [Aestuariibacter sp. A3R04]
MTNRGEIVPENEVDLTTCDKEPIHLPGSVQSFGFLLALQPDWLIAYCSENTPYYLGNEWQQVLGEPLKNWFDRKTMHDMRSALQSAMITQRNERLFNRNIVVSGKNVDISIHHNGEYIVVECEEVHNGYEDPEHFVRSLLTQFYRANDSSHLIEMVAQQIQLISGYDRVMVYRFLPDGAGEVIAESKRFELESFLGLRYPASDIPKQARALYIKNLLRVIGNVEDTVVPIQPANQNKTQPLDLSFSTLRAVSPIHIEYLKNMGVNASMSISIVVNGKLWGLFACHHYSEKIPSYFMRTELEMFAEVFALELSSRLAREKEVERTRARNVHNQMIATMPSDGALKDIIATQFAVLRNLISCDGICVVVDGQAKSDGATLSEELLFVLCRKLNGLAPSEVAPIETLAAFIDGYQTEAHGIAGVLAIPLSKSPRDYLLFFRKPQTKTVNWAGNPQKPVAVGPNGARLLPRSSFELWKQTHSDSCHEWTEQTLQDAESLRITLLEVIIRHAHERDDLMLQASRKHEVLISELNHRVRNILNLVNAIVAQTEQQDRSLSEFVEVLTGRLVALASAHDQLTASEWAEVSFRRMLETEIQAYINVNSAIQLDGDDVLISPYAATPLVLVMHEMFTNAAKYGALSACEKKGTVYVRWHISEKSELVIEWQERGGPPVSLPERENFGLTMIKSVLPHELGGRADIAFEPPGLKATFTVPYRFLLINQAASKSPPEKVHPDEETSTVLPKEAIVVEDSLVIALDMQKKLRRMHIDNVSIAGSLGAARQYFEKRTPGLALFDVHLGRETTYELISEVRGKGVPVVIVSGYGKALLLPDSFDNTPVLTKPVSDSVLKETLSQLFKSAI